MISGEWEPCMFQIVEQKGHLSDEIVILGGSKNMKNVGGLQYFNTLTNEMTTVVNDRETDINIKALPF